MFILSITLNKIHERLAFEHNNIGSRLRISDTLLIYLNQQLAELTFISLSCVAGPEDSDGTNEGVEEMRG